MASCQQIHLLRNMSEYLTDPCAQKLQIHQVVDSLDFQISGMGRALQQERPIQVSISISRSYRENMFSKPMRSAPKLLVTAIAAGLGLSAALAAPVVDEVSFNLANLGFVYDHQAYGSGTDRLGVDFSSNLAPFTFKNSLGTAVDLAIGGIWLNESDEGIASISVGEARAPNVSVNFRLTLLNVDYDFSVNGTVKAWHGDIVDQKINNKGKITELEKEDFSIDWTDATFTLTNGPAFDISLTDQVFATNGAAYSQQFAKFTLKTLPTLPVNEPDTSTGTGGGAGNGNLTPPAPPNAVPEPATLPMALLALGLTVLMTRHRRQD